MGKRSKKGQTHRPAHEHHKAGEGSHSHHQHHNGNWYKNRHPQDDAPSNNSTAQPGSSVAVSENNNDSDGYITPLTAASTTDNRVSNMVISTPATWSDASLQTGASSSVDANSYMTGLPSPYFSGNSREALSEQELLHIFSQKITPEEQDEGPFLTTQEFQQKEDAIQKCLAGSSVLPNTTSTATTTTNPQSIPSTSTAAVDLWHLREFALDKGGFLCPDIRKRAWPKLFAVHQQMLGQEPMGLQSYASSSPSLARQVKRDTARTIWKVEECLALSQKYRQEEDAQLTATIEEHRQRLSTLEPKSRKTTDVSGVKSSGTDSSVVDNAEFNDKVTKQEAGACTECSPTEPESSGCPECDTPAEKDSESPQHASNKKDCHLLLHPQTGFPISGTLAENPRVHATVNEQQILYNIIQSTRPGVHYSGLQNIVALILMNLESPSLTRLMLERLASHHLNRHAHAPESISAGLSRLIHQVDLDLFLALEQDMSTVCEVCYQWITTWFAQDILDPSLASRLMDLFLVSHPSMPVYMAVSILTTHKSILSEVTSTGKTTTEVLTCLLRCLSTSLDRTQAYQRLDYMVQKATLFMQQVPPHQLISASTSYLRQPSLFQSGAPEWMSLSHAPTDYQLIQETQFVRSRRTIQETFSLDHDQEKSRSISFNDGSLDAPQSKRGMLVWLSFFVSLLIGICFWTSVYEFGLFEEDMPSYEFTRMGYAEETVKRILSKYPTIGNLSHPLSTLMQTTSNLDKLDGSHPTPDSKVNSFSETSFDLLQKDHTAAPKVFTSQMQVASKHKHVNSHHGLMSHISRTHEIRNTADQSNGLSRGANSESIEMTSKGRIFTMESQGRQKGSAAPVDHSDHDSRSEEARSFDLGASAFLSKPFVLRSWLDPDDHHVMFGASETKKLAEESKTGRAQIEVNVIGTSSELQKQNMKEAETSQATSPTSEIKTGSAKVSGSEAVNSVVEKEKMDETDGATLRDQYRSKSIVGVSSTPHPIAPEESLVNGSEVFANESGKRDEIHAAANKTLHQAKNVVAPVKRSVVQDVGDALASSNEMVWSSPLVLRSLLHPDDASAIFPSSNQIKDDETIVPPSGKSFEAEGVAKPEEGNQAGRLKVGSRHRRVHLGGVQTELRVHESSIQPETTESSNSPVRPTTPLNESYTSTNDVMASKQELEGEEEHKKTVKENTPTQILSIAKLNLNLQPNELRISKMKHNSKRLSVATKYCSQGSDCTILGHGPLKIDERGELTFELTRRTTSPTVVPKVVADNEEGNIEHRLNNRFTRVGLRAIRTVLSSSFPLACYLLLAL